MTDAPNSSRASYGILYRYVGTEVAFSLSVSMFFFYFLFFMNQLLLLVEDILSKEVSVFKVLLLVFYATPHLLVFCLPFGTLVGTLMGIGRLSSAREILAMRSCGISINRIFFPVITLGVVMAILSFCISDFFLPYGVRRFQELYKELLISNPRVQLRPHSVIPFDKFTIVTGEVDEQGVHQLLIIDKDSREQKRVIVARRGHLSEHVSGRAVLSLALEDILSHSVDERRLGTFSYLSAKKMVYNLLIEGTPLFSFSAHSPNFMRTFDVWETVEKRQEKFDFEEQEIQEDAAFRHYEMEMAYQDIGEVSLERINSLYHSWKERSAETPYVPILYYWRVGLVEKFSIPFSCLSFIFFAIPIGRLGGRAGRSLGFLVGLGVSILFWSITIGGRLLAMSGKYNPELMGWLPNLLILLAGAFFYIKQEGQ